MKNIIKIIISLICIISLVSCNKTDTELKKGESDNSSHFVNLEQYTIDGIEYDFLDVCHGNRVIATKDEKCGLFDITGEVVLPLEYDGIMPNIIKESDYEKSESINKDDFIVSKGNKSGIFDINGKEKLPIKYDSILSYFDNDRITVKLDNKFGQVDMDNNILIPFEYDLLAPHIDKNNLLSATKNGKYGYISADNEIIIDFNYDMAVSIEGIILGFKTYEGYYDTNDFSDENINNALDNPIIMFNYEYINLDGKTMYRPEDTYIYKPSDEDENPEYIISLLADKKTIIIDETNNEKQSIDLSNYYLYDISTRTAKKSDGTKEVVEWNENLSYRILTIEEFLEEFSTL